VARYKEDWTWEGIKYAIEKRIRRSWRWVLNTIFKRKYRLKLDGLDSNWHDRDYVLIHAMFQCLVDFIEKENPAENIDWESDDEHKNAWAEMNRLYKWWTLGRPLRDDINDAYMMAIHNEIDDAGFGHGLDRFGDAFKSHPLYPKWQDSVRFNAQMDIDSDNEDTENMIALIKIRHFMWT
jgi:hypothetical protein